MAKRAVRKRPAPKAAVTFNHALIYVSHVERASAFYKQLGFLAIAEELPYYARLGAPRGAGTLALHAAEPGRSVDAPGVRLYFEVEGLAAFCRRLASKGVAFKEMPNKKPWGWTHAYLDDPDGHEVSLYWAGAQRRKKSH